MTGTHHTHNSSRPERGPLLLFFAALAALAVPCAALIFTERLPLSTRLCGFMLPVAAYWLLLSLSRNIGRTVWLMFFFIFLSAFQLVLLYLFGNGPIAVDMFLNIITTNPGEVSELLGNLFPAIATVVVLYIPLLTAATVAARRKALLDGAFAMRQRRMAAAALAAATAVTAGTAAATPSFCLKADIFPLNACYNLALAVQRAYATAHYAETSAAFSFGARPTHDAGEREIYVLVVGETARACNFGLYGYGRNTTPRLARTAGLTAFGQALTQSNTTHKSVPMLLSAVSAADYDSIYRRKSIITAFKEAGFRTVFLSNQNRNHSFIDFFGSEADRCVFIKDDAPEGANVMDSRLLGYASGEIERSRGKLFIVLHTYGSHFTYNERYGAAGAHFRPDTDMSARRDNRASLINAYDNTVRQTDSLLAALTGMLAGSGASAAMIYTSDHGEDIFDDGMSFLHASPIPTYYQLHVPLLVWTSEEYAARHPETIKALAANSRKPVATSASVFHSMLDMAGIATPCRADSLSFAGKGYRPGAWQYLNDRNEQRLLSDIALTANDIRLLREKGMW